MLGAGGILSLSNYSWTVGLQIVSLGTHGVHYLLSFVGKLLLEEVGILSLSNYSWTLANWIALLAMHGLHYLFALVMEYSWLRQVEL